MCACEEEFARRFLPHQITEAAELETQRRISVTMGFQKGICNACRGLPEEAHPKTEIYGRTSKVVRYYWREIFFETTRRFAGWAERQGYTDYDSARAEHRDAYTATEKEVIKQIKELHERCPKYVYQEESQSEIIKKYKVEVIRFDGAHVKRGERGVGISAGGSVYSVEEFAALHYRQQGYEVLFAESRPFHVLFGVFMWLLIQDPSDPRVRIVSFGDRTAYEEKIESKGIWVHLPEDFGTSGYAARRVAAVEEHLALIPTDKEELLWTFDYWVEPSDGLRQYLWAHRLEDVDKARKIISVLPVDATHRILRYLAVDYWRRYTGWPDLLVYRQDDFFFAEVKSSKDKLGEDQKNWVRGNSTELHLPYKLIKIHKKRGRPSKSLEPTD